MSSDKEIRQWKKKNVSCQFNTVTFCYCKKDERNHESSFLVYPVLSVETKTGLFQKLLCILKYCQIEYTCLP